MARLLRMRLVATDAAELNEDPELNKGYQLMQEHLVETMRAHEGFDDADW